MSGKVKMRCARCGKGFKSSGAKQTLCPDCMLKERHARAIAKTTLPQVVPSVAVQAPPRIVGPGAALLGAEPTEVVPPERPASGFAGRHATPGQHQGDVPTRAGAAAIHEQHSPTTTPTAPATHGKEHRPPRSAQQPPKTPKPPRTPPAPFVLTDELRATVEARYLELAQPIEFDGIRTRIAQELGIPRAAVKRAVLELRQRMQLPSWWELQSYAGDERDLERVRSAYVALLPIPPVGVHRDIAVQLRLDPGVVYQAIRRIRAELRLPQYNPPEMHGGEQPTPAQGGAAAYAGTPATGQQGE